MGEKRRVLVVDDDKSVCRLLRSKLGAEGYIVETENSGETGLDRLKSFSPDLVILDLLLPGMDGFQVCRRIRENPEFSHVPILMLTAVYMSEEDKVKGFRVGADDFLVKPDVILSKPVHLKELSSAVKAVFSGTEAPPAKVPEPDRILVVDDEESNLRLMTMRLRSEGFQVIEASSGAAALEKLEGANPHIILLDIKMPAMSGLDVLREVRRRGVDVPVVMMTAYGSETIAVEAFGLGADDYLIKPFDSAMAARRIHRLIERHRLKTSQERLTDRLKKISCDLVNRVNHLELQNERLEEAYTTVRGLSEFNQRFIKSLSNELRSPLAMILSFSSLLRDTPRENRDPESEQECLTAIFRTAFRLEVNLSNLIYLSRIQAGALEVVPTSLVIEPVVEETLALVTKALSGDDIRIRWYPESRQHRIKGDPVLLKDILVNLFDNAIQRMEGPGEISLELFLSEGSKGDAPVGVTLRLWDNGNGYAEEELTADNLLNLAPESLRLETEPVRLGLCRHLANLATWELSLSNRANGGGEALLRFQEDRDGA